LRALDSGATATMGAPIVPIAPMRRAFAPGAI